MLRPTYVTMCIGYCVCDDVSYSEKRLKLYNHVKNKQLSSSKLILLKLFVISGFQSFGNMSCESVVKTTLNIVYTVDVINNSNK